MLMDDKSYPFIKVTVNEPFPRVMLARQMKKDKAKYFGPYTSAGAVKDTIELIRKLYHIRSCNRSLPKDIGKERPCLNYHIHQCQAPCQGYISQEEYRKSIDEVVRFLNGHYDLVLKELEEKMMAASDSLEFEKAIEYRELLTSVQKVAQKQKITDLSLVDSAVSYGSLVKPTARYSTLQDLDAHRHTEIEMFSGALIRMGQELGIPTPYNEYTYHMIKAMEEKNDGLFDYDEGEAATRAR